MLGLSFTVFAQQRGITDQGEEVLLYDDGTWKFADESMAEAPEIPVNPQPMARAEASTFLVKSKRLQMGVYLDPKTWSFKAAENNPEAEFEFQMRGEDLYAMFISEGVSIPLTTLRNIALENGKMVAPDLRIDREEYRTVNGLQVLMLQMSGTMQGIEFTYLGYYYSNDAGTVQLVCYTAQNLIDAYRKDAEALLNGLVVY